MSYINRFSALHVCVPDTENTIGFFFQGFILNYTTKYMCYIDAEKQQKKHKSMKC